MLAESFQVKPDVSIKPDMSIKTKASVKTKASSYHVRNIVE